jgi:hypothetical protein
MIDHTPVDGKVVARFTTTPDEMIEAVTTLSRVLYGYAGLSRAAGFWKRFVAFFMGSFLGSVLLVSANRFILGSGGFTLRDFNIAVISAGVAGFLVMFALSRFQMRRMRAALVKHPESEDVEIIAGATGIWWNTRKEKHFWIYSKFDHVIAFKDGYYLVTGLSGGFIPGRGFDGESEKSAFERLLQEKLPHAAVAQFFAAKAQRSG